MAAKAPLGFRYLEFGDLDEVMPEVDRLLTGHETLGEWSLGQICDHLAAGIGMTIKTEGEMAPWIVRRTIGSINLRRLIRSGRFPIGIKVPDSFLPAPGSDSIEQAERLRAAIAALKVHIGPLGEHPVGGRLTRAEWERLHRMHCAHHLGFAVQQTSRQTNTRPDIVARNQIAFSASTEREVP